jgi:hypothetical protein
MCAIDYRVRQGATLLSGLLLTATITAAVQTSVQPTDLERGLAIAREADRRDSGWRDARVDVRMLLRSQHGETSERFLRSAWLEVPDDGDRTIVTFDRPADVKGSAVLTFSHKVGDDDRWIYLPAVGRTKRVASSNKAGPFMGSEFAFEDLASQEIEKYLYRYVRTDVWEGEPVWIVERDPLDPRSGYTRQLVWYDQAEYRPRKIDYFDRKNELLKTLTCEQYERVDRFWRARVQVMVNHQTGKSTRVEFGPFRFGSGLTVVDFSLDRLSTTR